MMLFTVQSLGKFSIGVFFNGNGNVTNIPVRNVPLMHEPEALGKECQVCLRVQHQVMCQSHFTYLREECHELAKGLETGIVK